MSRCKSCGAQIRWVKTEAGKSMPLDEKPVPDGNVRICGGFAFVTCEPPISGEVRFISHFVTCPNAKHHRKEA